MKCRLSLLLEELKKFWQRFKIKVRYLVGYPTEILPNNAFLPKLTIMDLLDKYPNLCVSRCVDGTPEAMIERPEGMSARLSLKALKSSVLNFSTNLEGGKFCTKKHIMYRPNTEFVFPWKGEEISTVTKDSYRIIGECFPVYYSVDDVNEKPCNINKGFDKKEDWEDYIAKFKENHTAEVVCRVFQKGMIQIPFIIRVEHDPTNMNYWHTVFNVYPQNMPNYIVDCDDTQLGAKRIQDNMRTQYLVRLAKFESVQDYKFEEADYVDTSVVAE